jgi:hypothetical protein
MRCRPRVEQLECRDTPSSFNPASPVVSFDTPAALPGVPFSCIDAPTLGLTDIIAPNYTGFTQSAVAAQNAGVYGAPFVILNGPC